ncbi:MAG: hypothetical protein DWG76_06930 [Chloroflexi bacterium]|nr:hypothetical protein [Chloroflexota bacterium]
MFAFLPFLLLALGLLALAITARVRPDFRSYWLVAIAASALTWLALLILRTQLPLDYNFLYWQPALGPELRLAWSLDAASWPLAFALVTMLVAFHLTEVSDLIDRRGVFWVPGLAVAAVSMLATLSANALSLLLTLALLDTMLLFVKFLIVRQADELRVALVDFSIKVLASVVLLAAFALSADSANLHLSAASSATHFALFLTAALRLSVLPLNPLLLKSDAQELPTSAFLRLAQAVPVFALLARLNTPLEFFVSLLLILLALAGLYAAAKWLTAPNDHDGFPYWVAASSTLVLAAALLGQPQAALAWALTSTLIGAFLVFARLRASLRWPVLILGPLLLIGLPFTLNGAALTVYAVPPNPLVYAFIPIHALLLLGWLRHAVAKPLDETTLEPWITGILAFGLLILPAAHLALGLGLAPGFALALQPATFPALIAILFIAGFLVLLARRAPQLPANLVPRLEMFFSLRWLYRLGELVLRQFARLLQLFSDLLEGPAGVFWTLLVVALLLSLITQLTLPG